MLIFSDTREFAWPKYDGFTPTKRVSGKTMKLPIGATGGPHFRDFANRNDPHWRKTRWDIESVGNTKILLDIDSRGEFNLSSGSIFQN